MPHERPAASLLRQRAKRASRDRDRNALGQCSASTILTHLVLNTDKPIVIDNVALVYDSLPPPVRKAIGTAVTRIAISVAGGFLRFWWARVIGSKDERAVRDALSAAVVASVGAHSDVQSIGLAKALSRQPFAGLITRVLQNPHDEINEQECGAHSPNQSTI